LHRIGLLFCHSLHPIPLENRDRDQTLFEEFLIYAPVHFYRILKSKAPSDWLNPAHWSGPMTQTLGCFTNAGMVQFKDVVFWAKISPIYTCDQLSALCSERAVNTIDLENVEYTARPPHFLLKCLGNLSSFGDYFKKEAFTYAWKFSNWRFEITKRKAYLWLFYGRRRWSVWIFGMNDCVAKRENYSNWRITKVDVFFVSNFWAMATTVLGGPCLKCFTIMASILGGPPALRKKMAYRFIWNFGNVSFQCNSIFCRWQLWCVA